MNERTASYTCEQTKNIDGDTRHIWLPKHKHTTTSVYLEKVSERIKEPPRYYSMHNPADASPLSEKQMQRHSHGIQLYMSSYKQIIFDKYKL